jgi:hypothetical protein
MEMSWSGALPRRRYCPAIRVAEREPRLPLRYTSAQGILPGCANQDTSGGIGVFAEENGIEAEMEDTRDERIG